MAGAAGDAGGDVQDPVAEGGDLTAGQLGVVAESDQLSPCRQIGCTQDDFEPGSVGVKRPAREVGQPGGLQVADAVLVIPTSG